ncbi:TIGR03084 family protein [Pseudarthrobacter sp. NIBRBAC000502772]|uniref:TIGR03084 family metal-binding protein n=1 Tax=Pseudarthrobacter sp. NIBRBAC000502772 TaxID=2590775 RepID=UPI00113052CC|nr:TIGR03084 family metal-binding protein [Pseudarthrobacter sp. NIBRBAC000502772]QDG66816.1 TIGR03084 family protein [Pseudarthrobacter sp. NIBRBAC000502772]
MSQLTVLLGDLEAETKAVETMLASLAPQDWDLPTPADGWAVRDQISHLAYFDDVAMLAALSAQEFRALRADLLAVGGDVPDRLVRLYRDMDPVALLDWFRSSRARLLKDFAALPPKARISWFGPDMSILSAVTARLMETWAHGHDVADALGLEYPESARLRHIADLGVKTLGFSFTNRGLKVPDVPVRVRLIAPDGGEFAWGPEDAVNSVSGPAVDFCLVVTQRRHKDDSALLTEGPVAEEWLSIAQAYAGEPGPGRTPTGL